MTTAQEQRRSVIYNALVTFGAVFFSTGIGMPFTALQLYQLEYPCTDQTIVMPSGETGTILCDKDRDARVLTMVNLLNNTFWYFLIGGGYTMLIGFILGLNIRFQNRDPILVAVGIALAIVGFVIYLWIKLFIP